MKNDKKICTFTFANGTVMRCAVPYFDKGGDLFSFESMFYAAKVLCWECDEEAGRGALRCFEVGDVITA